MPVRPIALVSAVGASGIAVSGAALVVADTPAAQRVAAPASPLFAEPIVSSPDPACSRPPATFARPPAPSGWAPDRMRAAFWGIGGPIAGVGFAAADAAAPPAGVVMQCRTLRLRFDGPAL